MQTRLSPVIRKRGIRYKLPEVLLSLAIPFTIQRITLCPFLADFRLLATMTTKRKNNASRF